MTNPHSNLTKTALLAGLLLVSLYTMAQDGTIYPLDVPAEPNAILLGTGGVKDQPVYETWFRQWGDPMAEEGVEHPHPVKVVPHHLLELCPANL